MALSKDRDRPDDSEHAFVHALSAYVTLSVERRVNFSDKREILH